MTSTRSAILCSSVFQRLIIGQMKKSPIRSSINLMTRNSYIFQPKHKQMFTSTPRLQNNSVKVTFVLSDGERHEVKANIGDNLLDIIIDNDVDIDGYGACEGTLACSTCHLIFKDADYEKIPDTPTDEELDMLDLAYGLTDTSRLGCQVIVTKDMDGLEVRVPAGVADARGGGL